MSAKKLTKVNIGSGPHGKPDWINLDWGILPLLSKLPWLTYLLVKLRLLPEGYNFPWPSKPRLRDCQKRLPFSESSVDFIYTSHFLEHIPHYRAIEVLAECKRILRPSGVIRISVPDLKKLAEKYIKDDIEFFLELYRSEIRYRIFKYATDMFVRYFYGYDLWKEPTFIEKMQRKFIRGHLWMYDYKSLSDILYTVGFKFVQRCEPGHGQIPDIEYLDIDILRKVSLYVEASCSRPV